MKAIQNWLDSRVQRLNANSSFRLFALIFGVVLVAMFWEVLVGERSFFIRDYQFYGYPVAKYYRDSFWRGEMPLWNPLSNCGLPFAAQWSTLTLYPGSLVYLLLPMPWSLSFFCVLHLWLGGLGMYILTRAWSGNSFSAAVAAVAYVLSGFILTCLEWPNNTAALAWLPWVFHFTTASWKGQNRALLWAAAAGTMQMMTGSVEIILSTWIPLGVLWLQAVLWPGKDEKRPIWQLPLTVVLITLLSAVQLLPFLDFLQHAHRSASYSDAPAWPMPVWGFANFLVPLFRYGRGSNGVFTQIGQSWTATYYVGVVVLLLALLALYRVQDKRLVTLFGLSLVGLLLALGEGGFLYPLLRKAVPQIGFMRFPIKFVILSMFVFPLLAGYGAKRLIAAFSASPDPGTVRLVTVLVTVFTLASCGILWFAHEHPFNYESWDVTLRSGVSRVVLLLILVAVLVVLRRKSLDSLMPVALLVFIVADALTHSPSQIVTVTSSAYEPGLTAAELKPLPTLGRSRALMGSSTYELMHTRVLADPLQDYIGRRLALFNNTGLIDGISTAHGFFSLELHEMREVWFSALASTKENSPLADFVGVSHISDPNKFLAWQTRSNYMPMVTIGQQAVFEEDSKILSAISSEAFRPREVVYLPEEARSQVRATNRTSGTISDLAVKAHRIGFKARSEGPAMLVIAQAYYHNWKAYLDDQPVPLRRANFAFQAVELPGGDHQVRLEYEDRFFRLGALTSILTALGCVLFAILEGKALRSSAV